MEGPEMKVPKRYHIHANTFLGGRKLPKGWSWGKFWCDHESFGWWVIRDVDVFVIKVVDDPHGSMSVAKEIRLALAQGIIPKPRWKDRR